MRAHRGNSANRILRQSEDNKMAAPTGPKTATARAQVLGTNVQDTIDLMSITSTATLPYNARGGGGNDFVFGNLGDNDLYGDNGNDVVVGRTGNDRVEGGAGDDTLIGDNYSVVVNGPLDASFVGPRPSR
jgi:Ca2+-binding RTX toxin-like protein